MTDTWAPRIDPGQKVGPVPASDPITGSPRVLEEKRRSAHVLKLAEQEQWDASKFLGGIRLEKAGRILIDVTRQGGYVFSDEADGVLVHCWIPQVRAVLRGTRCTCQPKTVPTLHGSYTECNLSRHDSTCPLSEVA